MEVVAFILVVLTFILFGSFDSNNENMFGWFLLTAAVELIVLYGLGKLLNWI